MQNHLKIAAIIVTYNRKQLLDRCLQCLLNQIRPLDAIIIIDNSATDGTPELLKEKGYLTNSVIDYHRMTENIGIAGGLAEGLKIGCRKNFDWFWSIDDDMCAEKDALFQLVSSDMFDKEKTGFLTGVILDENGNILFKSQPAKDFNLTRIKPSVFPKRRDYTLPYFRIKRVSYGGMLVNRQAIEKIGLPDKEFFIWHDDMDFSLRITKYFEAYCIPKCRLRHYETISAPERNIFGYPYRLLPKNALWKDYYGKRNRIFIQVKYSRPVTSLIITIIYFIFWTFAILIYGDNKPKRIWITIKAVADGLRGKLGKITQ